MNAFRRKRKAQLSMEFLLVMAGFVFVLALFTPVAVRASKNALYALELEKARAFLSEFKSAAGQASLLADGTACNVKAHALAEWNFNVIGGTASVTIKSSTLGRSETITASVPEELPHYGASFKGSHVVRIEKSHGAIFLESAGID